jgi:predicted nucleotidyltransferase
VTDTDFPGLLRVLSEGGVEFIIIGGVAAVLQGSAHVTYDLDVLYRRTPDNLQRIARSLEPIAPYLRGAPPGLPFHLDAATLARGLNFTLITSLGDLDLLGEVSGFTYEQLQLESEQMTLEGYTAYCVSLRRLIALKRSAGRQKDLDALAGLEALLEERERLHGGNNDRPT